MRERNGKKCGKNARWEGEKVLWLWGRQKATKKIGDWVIDEWLREWQN